MAVYIGKMTRVVAFFVQHGRGGATTSASPPVLIKGTHSLAEEDLHALNSSRHQIIMFLEMTMG